MTNKKFRHRRKTPQRSTEKKNINHTNSHTRHYTDLGNDGEVSSF